MRTKHLARHPRPCGRAVAGIAYGLWILLLGLWQFAPRGWFSLWGGRPLLLIPFTVSAAMFAGPLGGAWTGVAAGLLWGLYADAPFGFHALLLLLLGCTAGMLVRLLLRNNALSAALLCGGGAVAFCLVHWAYTCLFFPVSAALVLLYRAVLPDLLCTLLLSLPIYAAVRATAKRLTKRG